MLKKIIIGSLLLGGSVFGGTINVAVAANVAGAMPVLIKEFNKTNPDTKVETILSSSGKLTAQIKNGAPYVVFMSADMKYPAALYEDKAAITEPKVYAQGALAMFSAKDSYDMQKGISLITEDSVGKVAIANPKTAPYGTAAVAAMKDAGIYDKVEPKLVYAESISQTVQYAMTAADIGFINKSALFGEKMTKYKEGVNWVTVDPKLYKPIEQGVVLLKNGENNAEAKAFYDFILSEKAKTIFESYGYLVP